MPISAELRNLQRVRATRRTISTGTTTTNSSRSFVSEVGSKYTSRGVRFLGTILDPVSKYIQERGDHFFEGRTGDRKMFDVTTQKYENSPLILRL
jgi:hypothetical protein